MLHRSDKAWWKFTAWCVVMVVLLALYMGATS